MSMKPSKCGILGLGARFITCVFGTAFGGILLTSGILAAWTVLAHNAALGRWFTSFLLYFFVADGGISFVRHMKLVLICDCDCTVLLVTAGNLQTTVLHQRLCPIIDMHMNC
ncbi:hypothetical protein KC19_6G193300 [Ceratodon purpureus]|uniref:Uncharacterized protein n=1 Tax=Ceratodon purpureus TaxID=3225 RepID=A0A8T0HJA7_CERPU|nr:hypothetical protein KC19_6G193300 [Ceratodon purpureus]